MSRLPEDETPLQKPHQKRMKMVKIDRVERIEKTERRVGDVTGRMRKAAMMEVTSWA